MDSRRQWIFLTVTLAWLRPVHRPHRHPGVIMISASSHRHPGVTKISASSPPSPWSDYDQYIVPTVTLTWLRSVHRPHRNPGVTTFSAWSPPSPWRGYDQFIVTSDQFSWDTCLAAHKLSLLQEDISCFDRDAERSLSHLELALFYYFH